MSDECRFCPTCHDHWHNPLNEPELENCQNCNPQVMQGVVVFPDGSRVYKNMTSEQISALLSEAKAEAWQEGAVWQRANAVPDDRRMKVRFVRELQAVNPYWEGEK